MSGGAVFKAGTMFSVVQQGVQVLQYLLGKGIKFLSLDINRCHQAKQIGYVGMRPGMVGLHY